MTTDRTFTQLDLLKVLEVTEFELRYIVQSLNLDQFGSRLANEFLFVEVIVLEICNLLCSTIPELNSLLPLFRYDKVDYNEYLEKQYCALWMDQSYDQKSGAFRALLPVCSNSLESNVNVPSTIPEQRLSEVKANLQKQVIVVEEYTDINPEKISRFVSTNIILLDLKQVRQNLLNRI